MTAFRSGKLGFPMYRCGDDVEELAGVAMAVAELLGSHIPAGFPSCSGRSPRLCGVGEKFSGIECLLTTLIEILDGKVLARSAGLATSARSRSEGTIDEPWLTLVSTNPLED